MHSTALLVDETKRAIHREPSWLAFVPLLMILNVTSEQKSWDVDSGGETAHKRMRRLNKNHEKKQHVGNVKVVSHRRARSVVIKPIKCYSIPVTNRYS